MTAADVVPWGFPQHTERRPCEWGPCGHCDAGRHDRCQFVTHPPKPRRHPSPHGWVLDTRGRVTLPNVAVFVTGCWETWVCACHRAGHAGVGAQAALFEVSA